MSNPCLIDDIKANPMDTTIVAVYPINLAIVYWHPAFAVFFFAITCYLVGTGVYAWWKQLSFKRFKEYILCTKHN